MEGRNIFSLFLSTLPDFFNSSRILSFGRCAKKKEAARPRIRLNPSAGGVMRAAGDPVNPCQEKTFFAEGKVFL